MDFIWGLLGYLLVSHLLSWVSQLFTFNLRRLRPDPTESPFILSFLK